MDAGSGGGGWGNGTRRSFGMGKKRGGEGGNMGIDR